MAHNVNDTPQPSPDWRPPSNFEERLRAVLFPPRLYYRLRAHRELKRGEAELKLLPFLVDPTRVALDVGANKGVYTYWLERLAKHVHAFEPNPKIFDILDKGVGDKVTTHFAALSDQTGEFALRIPETSAGKYSNQGASLNYDKVGERYGEVMVHTHRLDDLDLGPIGFMKIDVEGHEAAVLDGALATIERDHPALLIELEQRHTQRPILEDIEKVEALGYRMMFLHQGVLQNRERFDAKAHHTDFAERADYVFNFIFLPLA